MSPLHAHLLLSSSLSLLIMVKLLLFSVEAALCALLLHGLMYMLIYSKCFVLFPLPQQSTTNIMLRSSVFFMNTNNAVRTHHTKARIHIFYLLLIDSEIYRREVNNPFDWLQISLYGTGYEYFFWLNSKWNFKGFNNQIECIHRNTRTSRSKLLCRKKHCCDFNSQVLKQIHIYILIHSAKSTYLFGVIFSVYRFVFIHFRLFRSSLIHFF